MRVLDRIWRNADDPGDLIDGFVVVIDEVHHFTVGRRQLRQALADDRAASRLVSRRFRIVRGIFDARGRVLIQRLVDPAPDRGERLVSRNRQQPCRNSAFFLEPTGGAPDIEEHVADEVLGQARISCEAEGKTVEPRGMPSVEQPHRGLVAGGDEFDQSLVRCFRASGRDAHRCRSREIGVITDARICQCEFAPRLHQHDHSPSSWLMHVLLSTIHAEENSDDVPKRPPIRGITEGRLRLGALRL